MRWTLLHTDIAIAVPKGTYGRIASRSDLAAKHHLAVGAGVIDADYLGNVKVLLFNRGTLDFHVSKCDRIAQLLLERVSSTQLWQWTHFLTSVVELKALVKQDFTR